jgi:hypothetical protein
LSPVQGTTRTQALYESTAPGAWEVFDLTFAVSLYFTGAVALFVLTFTQGR